MPKILLHAEGAIFALAATFFYFQLEGSWQMYMLLFLAPDLLMVGYLVNKKVGAFLYNLAHTYTLPALLLTYGIFVAEDLHTLLALIWIAHIGVDRQFGFGLKYDTHFKHTHFQRI